MKDNAINYATVLLGTHTQSHSSPLHSHFRLWKAFHEEDETDVENREEGRRI